jgi:hypothetical protein
MGLDMYLYADRNFWGYGNSEDKALASDIAQLIGIDNIAMPVKNVRLEAGYWRKANHIHKWFVDYIQEGKDECEEHYVTRDYLNKLHKVCQEVLDDNTKASTLLPTAEGFFFGGKDYDQWYYADIANTIKIIDNALALPDCWDLYYRSSW